MWFVQLTVRHQDICHICVVRRHSGEQSGSRGAANSNRAIMPGKSCTFIHQVLLNEGHVGKGIHMNILVVCQDHNDVRFSKCQRLGQKQQQARAEPHHSVGEHHFGEWRGLKTFTGRMTIENIPTVWVSAFLITSVSGGPERTGINYLHKTHSDRHLRRRRSGLLMSRLADGVSMADASLRERYPPYQTSTSVQASCA